MQISHCKNHFQAPFELKSSDAQGKFSGYASMFGNTDLGGDVILAGAFKEIKKQQNGKVRVALHHDLKKLVGDASVRDDGTGLKVEGQLNMELSYAADTLALMKGGQLDGMSVGFNILPDGAEYKISEDDVVRVISKAELWEVSIVPFGMNPQAKIDSVKQMDGVLAVRKSEAFLREFGFSRRDAKAKASGLVELIKSDALSDSGVSDSVADSVTLDDLKSCFAKYI